jgi:hypothetical protein
MDNKMKAALVGGAIAGVLSAVLGVIPLVGACCFLWALAGGFLAVFLYLKGTPGPMTPGDGAKLGLRAGIIGAIIYVVIALPLTLLMGGAAISQAIQQSGGSGMAGAGLAAGLGAFAVVVVAVIILGFTTLGSVIGAAILGKGGAAGVPPPPPPPVGGGYGGPGTPGGGGGYGGGAPGGGTPGGGYGQGV